LKVWRKIEILGNNWKFDEKLKFWVTIEILTKNWNFDEKLKFRRKNNLEKNSIWTSEFQGYFFVGWNSPKLCPLLQYSEIRNATFLRVRTTNPSKWAIFSWRSFNIFDTSVFWPISNEIDLLNLIFLIATKWGGTFDQRSFCQ